MSFLRLLVSQGETKLNNITYKSGGTVMKTRTKLLAALLSTVTALSCALTAAAAPAITMQGNEMTPADGTKEGGTLQFTITAKEFTEVAGADLEITIPENVKPYEVEVTSNDASWVAKNATDNSGNYIFNATTRVLKIVDVFNVGRSDITALNLTVTVRFHSGATIGTYNTANNVKLVGEDLKDIACSVTNASLVVGKMSADVTPEDQGDNGFDTVDYFLPNGSLVAGGVNIPKENNTGKFNFTGTATATYFKQPVGNNVTTFGISRKAENDKNTIQFGSYINDIADDANSCGTVLVFSKELTGTLANSYEKGDFDGALAAADSLDGLLEGIVKAYEGVGDKTKFYPYVYANNKIIYVRVVKQTSYMWKSSTADTLKKLQYAVRCQVSDTDRVFTAAGYICNTDGKYNFSKEVKSGSFSSLAG